MDSLNTNPRRITVALAILMVLAWGPKNSALAFAAAAASEPAIPFSMLALETSAGEGSAWQFMTSDTLRIGPNHIAGPATGQDRAQWLGMLKSFRQRIRQGIYGDQIGLNGKSAWVRLSMPLTRAMNLKPGDRLHVSIEARLLSGNNRLCAAFDLQDRANETAWMGWTGPKAFLPVPADGQWHRLEATVEVPAYDAKKFMIRPIVGLDETVKPPQGQLTLRVLDFRPLDAGQMNALAQAARKIRPNFTRAVYDRPENAWLAGSFTCHFTFLYDQSIHDARTGRYRLKEFLDDGQREFGGYDIILLWQAYPRLGFDERNQFDFYHDLPGGLEGIADLARQAHERGVKVFINYNPWDQGTRRTGRLDEDMLVELVEKTQLDGIFLDTMRGTDESLRRKLDQARPGIALSPEGSPSLPQLPLCNSSWAQWLDDFAPPGMLLLKWAEPRHMQYQITRWSQTHRAEIRSAFFNGSGMLVWENVFGTYNPWPIQERRMWRRAVAILRRFKANFTSDAWDPFYPTPEPDLHAHRWPGTAGTVYTMLKDDEPSPYGIFITQLERPLLELPHNKEIAYFDLWNGAPMKTERAGNRVRLLGQIDRVSGIGAVLAIEKKKVDRSLLEFLDRQRQEALRPAFSADPRNEAQSLEEPEAVEPTRLVQRGQTPEGMVHVPATTFSYKLEHTRREMGCYPDPGTSADLWQTYLWGAPFDRKVKHQIGPVQMKPFYIDEAAVTNSMFERFLAASRYHPRQPENFLKHWPKGKMPPELADCPVVYVDLDDARAYAKWAGKRLPTENEWQLAAQGTDGRAWPWGRDFDPKRVNTTGGPMPARALPEGRSPYGCYQMAGNVWELTESRRDDGHTRFLILRGGSYYQLAGSVWYAPCGPQPCSTHAKFLLLCPGLDRCSTIGFRCVKDAE